MLRPIAHAFFAIAASSLTTLTVAAQSKHASNNAAAVQRQLLEIEEEIARANRDCDYLYFRRIEADEFIFTDANGAMTTRKEDLAGEKDCKKNASVQKLDEVVVQLHGDVAVISARAAMPGSREGQPTVRRSRFTDVFVWRGGRWQLVVGHSSRIP
ncbi:MAG: nuclear transport factor 2 family protein [Gemmatimonadaceae bacterium]